MNRAGRAFLILLLVAVVFVMLPSAAFAEGSFDERELAGSLWSKPEGDSADNSMNSWVYIAIFIAIFLLFAGKKAFGKKSKAQPQVQRKESDFVYMGTPSSLSEIQKKDPDFSEKEFALEAAGLFKQVFDAMYGEPLTVRERIGKKVLDKIEKTAAENAAAETPALKAEVYEATISSYSKNLINDIIAIQLAVRICDPENHREEPRYTYYDLYFVKDSGYMADERTLDAEQQWVLSQMRELKR